MAEPAAGRSRYGVPGASYRLQLLPGFGFADARKVVPYLARLGITHLYLSPIFAAAPGSMHGYDVFDHNKVNPELGGVAGLYELGEALIAHNMGLIADIVPNHVGIAGGANPWWRSVLRYGEASPSAAYFDIDWQAQPHMATGVLVFPVLGQPFGRALESGELRLSIIADDLAVTYFDMSLPLRPESYARVLGLPPLELREKVTDPAAIPAFAAVIEDLESGDFERCEAALPRLRSLLHTHPALTEYASEAAGRFNGDIGDTASFDALDELLRNQHYRLTDWRVAGAEVNYRRFFDQNTLAAIRMEREDVFEETHRLLFDLAARGIVTGVRVDHIDGLYAPGEYLERLQRRLTETTREIPGAEIPIFVEKILQEGERLPSEWPISGTTGYDALAEIDRVFVDPGGASETTRTYLQFVGQPVRFEQVRYESKRQVAREAFAGEISVLAHQAHRIAQRNRLHRDNTLRALRDAIEGTVACFPVYRTYVGAHDRAIDDAAYIDQAIDEAPRRNPNLSDAALEFLREVLQLETDDLSEEDWEKRAHFRRRFQQITGPVLAKGLEDTAFFRFNRLLSLNEVGGDPSIFGAELADTHAWSMQRAAEWPQAMTASSTHDTKRSEDVRARLNVLSELPHEWRREVNRWAKLNERHRGLAGGEPAPGTNLEYAIYQTLVGSWPDGGVNEGYRARLRDHLIKMMREAKRQTSWIRPDEAYEHAVLTFLEVILNRRKSGTFLRRLDAFVARLRPAAAYNTLGSLTLKSLVPGFPDFYQGTELLDLSLTDPDNRRPVDFDQRERLLASLQCDAPPGDAAGPSTKLWLTHRLLQLRLSHRTSLEGGYGPLAVHGDRARNVFAFVRGASPTLAAVVPRLAASLITDGRISEHAWGRTTVTLPAGGWTNLLTGAAIRGGEVSIATLLAEFPVAVLESE